MDSGGLNEHLQFRSELENDCGGRWWTVNPMPGSQKVRGSNPLGSTIDFVFGC